MESHRNFRKQLRILADDFCLLSRKDTRDAIQNCQNYEEGHKLLMKIYEKSYMR